MALMMVQIYGKSHLLCDQRQSISSYSLFLIIGPPDNKLDIHGNVHTVHMVVCMLMFSMLIIILHRQNTETFVDI